MTRSISTLSAFLAACGGLTILASPVHAQDGATATFINAEGQEIGSATLIETPSGVLIDASLSGLAAGGHGFHVHETGQCDAATGFKSAGGHFEPGKHAHGYLSADGPHAGDLPNQFVGSDGELHLQVLNPGVTLGPGERSLFDADGSALVLHAQADDYSSQPSGAAGDRLACAIVERR